MKVERFANIIKGDFFTGVPDSQLKPLCDYLYDTYGTDGKHHVIAANEGNCTAIAAGYHLATGKIPVVYMQNSGEGNMINPAASLLHSKVYAIPVLFVIGWRGEPDTKDEPQHMYQGEVTLKLLADMDIESFVLGKETAEDELLAAMEQFHKLFLQGKSAAVVVRKGALSYDNKVQYKNSFILQREEVIRHIIQVSGQDPIVSTTGKASRELFELREEGQEGHQYDFLTVGSMGHSSSIALGIALHKPDMKLWCIDGDGAVLMHMGAMAVIGALQPKNLVHIVINNNAHETVGGMPTAMENIDLIKIAEGCGYMHRYCADTFPALDKALRAAKTTKGLTFLEVKCALGARESLGRPTTTAKENKAVFMEYLKNM